MRDNPKVNRLMEAVKENGHTMTQLDLDILDKSEPKLQPTEQPMPETLKKLIEKFTDIGIDTTQFDVLKGTEAQPEEIPVTDQDEEKPTDQKK